MTRLSGKRDRNQSAVVVRLLLLIAALLAFGLQAMGLNPIVLLTMMSTVRMVLVLCAHGARLRLIGRDTREMQLATRTCSHWDHVIILPSYNEDLETTQMALKSLIGQAGQRAQRCVVVVSYEHDVKDLEAKKQDLINSFGDATGVFKQFMVLVHQVQERELKGRGSNFAWAASQIKELLTASGRAGDMETMTLLVADGDCCFHPNFLLGFESALEDWEGSPHLVAFHGDLLYEIQNRAAAHCFLHQARGSICCVCESSTWLAPGLACNVLGTTFFRASAAGFCDPLALGDDVDFLLRAFMSTGGKLVSKLSPVPTLTGTVETSWKLVKQETRWNAAAWEESHLLFGEMPRKLPVIQTLACWFRILGFAVFDRLSMLILILGMTSSHVCNGRWHIMLWFQAGLLASLTCMALLLHDRKACMMEEAGFPAQRSPSNLLDIVVGVPFAFVLMSFCWAKALVEELRGHKMVFESSSTQIHARNLSS